MGAIENGLPRPQNHDDRPRFRPDMSPVAALAYIRSRVECFPRYQGSVTTVLPGTRASFIGERMVNIYDSGDAVVFTLNALTQAEAERLLEECDRDFPNEEIIRGVLFSGSGGDCRLNMTVKCPKEDLQITAKSEQFGIEDIEAILVNPIVFETMLALLAVVRETGTSPVQSDGKTAGFGEKRVIRELLKPGFKPRQVSSYKGSMKRKRRAAHRK